eukprot:CAMPEP_0118684930 /NCGR_PEP_ID=MMETSP0800-20121206/6931_1 /TAXON_ID=210618 ORGANISM="Striatella unipunctata, Strain CCMP2910" /NCGR_SAMPLE_ID=MMETSP0800 /ASSEMBLY_ACC=CAM_ASM_000638 /LENGTH=150 /DNA_ID=CAMNT_0006581719 /DNA_START=58 /DNA_END=510 /DNA_ORIENTATION=+
MSVVKTIRLRVAAGAAKPGPAIGQALGPLGVNMAEFCKQFNERTTDMYEKETPVGVSLTAMADRSFSFVVRSPPTTHLIKLAAGIQKGPTSPNPDRPVGFITPEMVYEIAKVKQKDDMRWHLPLEGIARSVIGTAKSMGVQVREAQEDDK